MTEESQVSEILDELIDAKHEVDAKRRAVEEYRDTHQIPPMPPGKVFSDAASLTEYTNAHARYVRGLDEAMAEQTRAEERFETQVGKIKAILPQEAHVFHSYAMRRSEHAGRLGKYRVTHTPRGLIDVVKFDD